MTVHGAAVVAGTAGPDRGLWSSFVTARGERAALTAWLALVVDRVAAARAGCVLQVDPAAGAFLPVAVVPDPRRDLSGMREIAEKVIASGRPATRHADEGGLSWAGWPLRAGEGPAEAVVILELQGADEAALQAALREIHWAAGWLAARLWERRAGDEAGRSARARVALDILALSSEQAKPAAAALVIVNEAQKILAADRISIGIVRHRRSAPRIRLMALSHSAWFRRRTALVEGLETAMEECFDQNGAVAHPPLASLSRAISVAHREHVRTSQTGHILSVPLRDEDGPIGVMTCERRDDRPFDESALLMAESIGALIGPVLELKRRNRRWFGGRLVDGTLHVLGILLGPRRLSWKLLAVAIAAAVVAGATVRGPFTVQAEAVLRGAEQRAAVAPFAGFIAEAPLRAGDTVAAGELLVRLDDSDLRLEDLRWSSEVDRLSSQARDALARHDRAQMALLEAQLGQAQAQLDLARAQLARASVLAPISGLIVSGDLSQRLGAPVQTGEVLFEIAPAGHFRLDLYVDERDLAEVAAGASGRLSLTGMPSEGLSFRVERITPLAEVREGANTFRAEATLDAAPDTTGAQLRPGMKGIGRIDAGRALYVWGWTRRMTDWLRRTLWTWTP